MNALMKLVCKWILSSSAHDPLGHFLFNPQQWLRFSSRPDRFGNLMMLYKTRTRSPFCFGIKIFTSEAEWLLTNYKHNLPHYSWFAPSAQALALCWEMHTTWTQCPQNTSFCSMIFLYQAKYVILQWLMLTKMTRNANEVPNI